ncbi:hypothetical protein B0T26DRAFT_732540 [Lasiosphaeria miniovina]|uniref:Uncharacterized protein n=1 Tax=Lasiosphaeria miniovina TaxID=1954250 RepID=A0AA39ZUF0_9PEZI|nr:uncharacterized protein B0T26DRAFT_732540 [Lasiosphaeria miniovina]KAK0703755.1 hypothetical protein B0T26DRAFT_732540 [Lasiosphaeria miniovina]
MHTDRQARIASSSIGGVHYLFFVLCLLFDLFLYSSASPCLLGITSSLCEVVRKGRLYCRFFYILYFLVLLLCYRHSFVLFFLVSYAYMS